MKVGPLVGAVGGATEPISRDPGETADAEARAFDGDADVTDSSSVIVPSEVSMKPLLLAILASASLLATLAAPESRSDRWKSCSRAP